MTAQVLAGHTGHSSEFASSREGTMSTSTDNRMPPPTPASPTSKDDPNRGRRRTRENEGQNGDDDDDEGADPGGSSRKRRRSRKGLDKKFDCPHEGCGKSYSRAEHLYRHQLNRTSTNLFRSRSKIASSPRVRCRDRPYRALRSPAASRAADESFKSTH